MAYHYLFGPIAEDSAASAHSPPLDASVRDALFDGVFTVDRHGRILDANLGGAALLGYTSGELRGLDVREVIKHGPDPEERRPFQTIVDGGHFYWSGWLRRKDDTAVAAEARIVRSSSNGYTIVAREKRAPVPAQAVEDAADDDVARLTRLRKNILESLNHEFRTPLTAILGYSQIIKDVIAPEYESIIDDIERSGNRLLEAFMTLIELAKLRANDYPLYPRVHDVYEIVQPCVERVRWLADQKDVDVSIAVGERPLLAHVDEYALKRILYSLVDNAVKFTDAGSVRVSLESTSTTIEIEVADTGIGICPEFLPLVFDAFTQESTGLNRIYQGAGMGLALASQLVQYMEGRIHVKSSKDTGSTFTIVLPRNMDRVR